MKRPLAKFMIGTEVTVPRKFGADIYGTIYDVMTFEDAITQAVYYEYAIQTYDGPITYARERNIRLYVSGLFKRRIDGLLEI